MGGIKLLTSLLGEKVRAGQEELEGKGKVLKWLLLKTNLI